jgi:transcriptional regulator with XRE-family HTH domain
MREKVLLAFGKRVRDKREAKSLSQEDLADLAGLDRTYISGIERGLRNPTLLISVKIAQAMGTTVEDLYKGIKA